MTLLNTIFWDSSIIIIRIIIVYHKYTKYQNAIIFFDNVLLNFLLPIDFEYTSSFECHNINNTRWQLRRQKCSLQINTRPIQLKPDIKRARTLYNSYKRGISLYSGMLFLRLCWIYSAHAAFYGR